MTVKFAITILGVLTIDGDVDRLPDVVLDAIGRRAGVRAFHGLGGQGQE